MLSRSGCSVQSPPRRSFQSRFNRARTTASWCWCCRVRSERHVSNRISVASFEHAISHWTGSKYLWIGRPRPLSDCSDGSKRIPDAQKRYVSSPLFRIQCRQCIDHRRKRWLRTRILCTIFIISCREWCCYNDCERWQQER